MTLRWKEWKMLYEDVASSRGTDIKGEVEQTMTLFLGAQETPGWSCRGV